MPDLNEQPQMNRRAFLRNLTITAAAATATGTGAALLANRSDEIVISSPGPPALPAAPDVPAVRAAENIVSLNQDATQLLARLAEAQAENMRLQAALDAAQRELEGVRHANQLNNTTSEQLTMQLDDATQQVSFLSGLVALYEALDQVDVGDVVENGLTVVSETLDDLMAQAPALSEGIAAGSLALSDIESHLPTLEAGRRWLEEQTDRAETFYAAVETVLQNVLESVGSFLELINAWFDDVRKWLPFGIGERAAEVVTSLSTLVAETPATVEGLRANVAQPLDAWLDRDADDLPRLQRQVIDPLRAEVLNRAETTLTQADAVSTTYREQLAEPVSTAVAARRALREQIAIYRQQNQV